MKKQTNKSMWDSLQDNQLSFFNKSMAYNKTKPETTKTGRRVCPGSLKEYIKTTCNVRASFGF